MGNISPMMQRYLTLKEQYKEEIIFFRLGDFYEMFFDDAIKASGLLGLTLTGRDCGMEERAPMCGVPHHAADGYIAKLIALGEKVAVCEQLEPSVKPNQLVARGVVRVITSGTAIDDNSLDTSKSNYLATVYIHGKNAGIAWTDITTGEFAATQRDGDSSDIEAVLSSLQVSEVIADTASAAQLAEGALTAVGRLPKPFAFDDAKFKYDSAYKTVTQQLKATCLNAYECEGNKAIVGALGALIEYLKITQMQSLNHINDLKIISSDAYMFIDANTRRNLEITANSRDGRVVGSILWALNYTKTPMGARLLRNWLEMPLINEKKINLRLNSVDELVNNNQLRANLLDELGCIRDIERLCCKVPNNNCTPRDFYALYDTLSKLPTLKKNLEKVKSPLLKQCRCCIDENEALTQLLGDAISEDATAIAREGGFIKSGFHAELDELRNAKSEGARKIAVIEAAEREKTGIKALKIKYNRVHGYHIEVPKSVADKVPFNYVRRQTTANSERYITNELREIEETILTADDKAITLEIEIFLKIKEAVASKLTSLQFTSQAIAKIDVLQAFATAARENDYIKPVIGDKVKAIQIKEGRHPIVEKSVGRNYYTPNDTYIDDASNRTMLITGPNMSGKSTYMRQVAAIALMAQVGSFVPAASAELPVFDRIFTRIGASDDLMSGQSTFMVEMLEMAAIIKNCTDSSLVILDEIGRGTSTSDGLSIAWAMLEYLSVKNKCKTLICTHYHELTQLEGLLDGVRNYRVSVTEIGGKVIFTHKIARGSADRSFGIEVAELAGVPESVTLRARDILDNLEENAKGIDINSIMLSADNKITAKTQQISFISGAEERNVCEKLRSIKMNELTPLQALVELDNLKNMLSK